MKRKHKKLRASRPMHLVARYDGSPMTELEPDCPICAMLAAQGKQVHSFDLDGTTVTPLGFATPPPMMSVLLTADDAVASVLGTRTREVEVPRGCSALELLAFLGYTEPALVRAWPEGDVELRQDGRCLDPMHVLEDGERVTLVALCPPRALPD